MADSKSTTVEGFACIVVAFALPNLCDEEHHDQGLKEGPALGECQYLLLFDVSLHAPWYYLLRFLLAVPTDILRHSFEVFIQRERDLRLGTALFALP